MSVDIRQYRSKPVVIDAMQFDAENYSVAELFTNGGFRLVGEQDRTEDPEILAEVWDKLHNTWVGVKKGQYIIKGTKGEFYPCDPDVFVQKYEPVS
jgi:hypothetical protein